MKLLKSLAVAFCLLSVSITQVSALSVDQAGAEGEHEYQYVGIENPYGPYTQPTAVNDAGYVVGTYWNNQGKSRAFYWNKDEGVLHELSLGISSTCDSYGRDINNNLLVTGNFSCSGVVDGFIYNIATKELTLLERPANTYASPYAINDNNVVVGEVSFKAVQWNEAGIMTDDSSRFPTIGSFSTDINNSNHFVGTYFDSFVGDNRSYFVNSNLDCATCFTDLGMLPNFDIAIAEGVNDNNVVVGFAQINQNQQARAFRWENGVMKNLGSLGGTYSVAYKVNDDGLIIGDSENSEGYQTGFVWRNGVMYDVKTLTTNMPQTNYVANKGLNEMGEIVGFLQTPSGHQGFILLRSK